MRQKIALAATLGPRTPLVVMDEPTSNLDPTARSEVLTLVEEAKAEGRTVLFSSHILSEVERCCDRTCIIRHGLLVHAQTMSELRKQHRIIAELNGPLLPPPAALAEGLSILEDGDGTVTIQTPGELSPLMGWLASLPLTEVRVEPIGLQAVYDRYHVTEE
jgi:ABC-2 type transport system ATP-binding protein